MVCIRFFGIFFIKISAKIKIYKINSSFLSKFRKILEFLKRICREVFKFLLVSSIFKTRKALVLHFVIKNQVIFKFQGILSTIFSDFFQNIQELVGKMNKVKKGIADKSFKLMILRTGVHCLTPYTTNSFT